MKFSRTLTLVALSLAVPAAYAADPVPWFQGFESDASGWLDNDDLPGYGDITRVTGPLTPYQGIGYAEVQNGPDPANDSAPFTRWGAYSTTFPVGGYSTSLAVYLDPSAMAVGDGFDFSSAANNPGGTHRRDFITHVGKQADGRLLIAGTNNSNFATRMDLGAIPNLEITTAGWYVLEQNFKNINGILAVDLNVRTSTGSVLFTETRSDPTDLINNTVGGNRYGWFTFTTGTFAIDNAQLVVPAPSALALLGLGGLVVGRRRR